MVHLSIKLASVSLCPMSEASSCVPLAQLPTTPLAHPHRCPPPMRHLAVPSSPSPLSVGALPTAQSLPMHIPCLILVHDKTCQRHCKHMHALMQGPEASCAVPLLKQRSTCWYQYMSHVPPCAGTYSELDDAALEKAVRSHLTEWFGPSEVNSWSHLRTYRIPFAQPNQVRCLELLACRHAAAATCRRGWDLYGLEICTPSVQPRPLEFSKGRAKTTQTTCMHARNLCLQAPPTDFFRPVSLGSGIFVAGDHRGGCACVCARMRLHVLAWHGCTKGYGP